MIASDGPTGCSQLQGKHRPNRQDIPACPICRHKRSTCIVRAAAILSRCCSAHTACRGDVRISWHEANCLTLPPRQEPGVVHAPCCSARFSQPLAWQWCLQAALAGVIPLQSCVISFQLPVRACRVARFFSRKTIAVPARIRTRQEMIRRTAVMSYPVPGVRRWIHWPRYDRRKQAHLQLAVRR